MNGDELPKVLCVDDEPLVLEGLALHLQRRYSLSTFTSPEAALAHLEGARDTAVIVSDMRMPGLNGAEFLARARQVAPDATRILLTGDADLGAAVSAVNDGQIFRFLTKPCASERFKGAVVAAVAQHRLVTSERVLLEQTLRGCVATLSDVLALTSPLAFGRSCRISASASGIATRIGLIAPWQIEVAAMLAELGAMTIPEETLARSHAGGELSDAERAMVERVPCVTAKLLGHIPRLEGVREILRLASSGRPIAAHAGSALPIAARVLRLATEFAVLEERGDPPDLIAATLTGRGHPQELLEALAATQQLQRGERPVHETSAASLAVGMTLVDDLRFASGVLLVARGYVVTEGLVEKIRNFERGAVAEPIRVYPPA